jgi:predicted RNase H-like HicB family nuclease
MKTPKLTIVIERDEDGRFVATCPPLQGCYTEGETEQEARELILDAIRLHLKDRDRPTDASGVPALKWFSKNMGPSKVDLEDKEALNEILNASYVDEWV